MYSGEISSMPPKLLTQDKQHVVIRPMVYCREAHIIEYAEDQNFPIIPCNLCGSQENLTRQKVKNLIKDLSDQNPKVPSNMLRALGNVRKSQLMDFDLWDFKNLENELVADFSNEYDSELTEEPFDSAFSQSNNIVSLVKIS